MLALLLLPLLLAGTGTVAEAETDQWSVTNGTVTVEVTNATRTEIWISLKDSCQHGDCPAGYAVTYREAGTNGSWTSMPSLGPGPEAKLVLAGLRPGARYELRVGAAELTASSCPAQPEGVKKGEVEAEGEHSALLSWRPPTLDCTGNRILLRWGSDWSALDAMPACENAAEAELLDRAELGCPAGVAGGDRRQCRQLTGLWPGSGYSVHIYVRDREGKCSEHHYMYVRTATVRLGGLGVGGWTAVIISLLATGAGIAYGVNYFRNRRARMT